MAVLTDDKNVLEKYNPAAFRHDYLGANATQFFKGGLVCIGPGGLLKKAVATDVGQVVGVSEDNLLTANATTRIGCRSGIFLLLGPGITAADVGKVAFVVDDQTVDISTATSLVAGVVYDINAATDPGGAGVWVAVNFPGFTPQVAGTAAGSQFSQ